MLFKAGFLLQQPDGLGELPAGVFLFALGAVNISQPLLEVVEFRVRLEGQSHLGNGLVGLAGFGQYAAVIADDGGVLRVQAGRFFGIMQFISG